MSFLDLVSKMQAAVAAESAARVAWLKAQKDAAEMAARETVFGGILRHLEATLDAADVAERRDFAQKSQLTAPWAHFLFFDMAPKQRKCTSRVYNYVTKLLRSDSNRQRKCAVMAPTGFGKTRVIFSSTCMLLLHSLEQIGGAGANIASHSGGKILITAPRIDLVRQIYDTFGDVLAKFGVPEHVCAKFMSKILVATSERDLCTRAAKDSETIADAWIVLTTPQWLNTNSDLLDADLFSVWMIDECDKEMTGVQTVKLFQKFSNAVVIGFSATPQNFAQRFQIPGYIYKTKRPDAGRWAPLHVRILSMCGKGVDEKGEPVSDLTPEVAEKIRFSAPMLAEYVRNAMRYIWLRVLELNENNERNRVDVPPAVLVPVYAGYITEGDKKDNQLMMTLVRIAEEMNMRPLIVAKTYKDQVVDELKPYFLETTELAAELDSVKSFDFWQKQSKEGDVYGYGSMSDECKLRVVFDVNTVGRGSDFPVIGFTIQSRLYGRYTDWVQSAFGRVCRFRGGWPAELIELGCNTSIDKCNASSQDNKGNHGCHLCYLRKFMQDGYEVENLGDLCRVESNVIDNIASADQHEAAHALLDFSASASSSPPVVIAPSNNRVSDDAAVDDAAVDNGTPAIVSRPVVAQSRQALFNSILETMRREAGGAASDDDDDEYVAIDSDDEEEDDDEQSDETDARSDGDAETIEDEDEQGDDDDDMEDASESYNPDMSPVRRSSRLLSLAACSADNSSASKASGECDDNDVLPRRRKRRILTEAQQEHHLLKRRRMLPPPMREARMQLMFLDEELHEGEHVLVNKSRDTEKVVTKINQMAAKSASADSDDDLEDRVADNNTPTLSSASSSQSYTRFASMSTIPSAEVLLSAAVDARQLDEATNTFVRVAWNTESARKEFSERFPSAKGGLVDSDLYLLFIDAMDSFKARGIDDVPSEKLYDEMLALVEQNGGNRDAKHYAFWCHIQDFLASKPSEQQYAQKRHLLRNKLTGLREVSVDLRARAAKDKASRKTKFDTIAVLNYQDVVNNKFPKNAGYQVLAWNDDDDNDADASIGLSMVNGRPYHYRRL